MNIQTTWILVLSGLILLLMLFVFCLRKQKPPSRKRRAIEVAGETNCELACQYAHDNPVHGLNVCEYNGCRKLERFAVECCPSNLNICTTGVEALIEGNKLLALNLEMCNRQLERYPTVEQCQAAIPNVNDMCVVTPGVLPAQFDSMIVVYKSGTGTIQYNTAEQNGDKPGNNSTSKWADVSTEKWLFTPVTKDGANYWNIRPASSTNPTNYMWTAGTGNNDSIFLQAHDSADDHQLWKFSVDNYGQIPQITNKARAGKYLDQNSPNWKLNGSESKYPFNVFPWPMHGQCTASSLDYKRSVTRAVQFTSGACEDNLADCEAARDALVAYGATLIEDTKACEEGMKVPITTTMCQDLHPVGDMCQYRQGSVNKSFTAGFYSAFNSNTNAQIGAAFMQPVEEGKGLWVNVISEAVPNMQKFYFVHIGVDDADNRYWITAQPNLYYLKGTSPPWFQNNRETSYGYIEWRVVGPKWNCTIQNVETGMFLYVDHVSQGKYQIKYAATPQSNFNGWSLNYAYTDLGCSSGEAMYR